MNSVNKFKYIVNMMGKVQILLMQKNKFDYCEIETLKSIQIWPLDLEKTISLGIL